MKYEILQESPIELLYVDEGGAVLTPQRVPTAELEHRVEEKDHTRVDITAGKEEEGDGVH